MDRMERLPQEISLDNSDLVIVWSDGANQRIKIRELRDKCPCANCREKRQAPPPAADGSLGLPVISLAEAAPLTIAEMQPVGNYAYSIRFSDGHANGIFTFDFLQSFQDTE